ncbi:MAG: hypothetical protein U1A78_35190 [Polyangia bacterium]
MNRLVKTFGISVAALLVGGSLAGCGGVSTFSCDKGSGTSHVCIYYDGVSGDVSAAKSSCTGQGGTVGTACATTGTVGACRVTAPTGEQGVVTTYYFGGTSSSVMQMCSSFGATYVAP